MPEYITLAELANLGINPAAFIDVPAPRRHENIAGRSDYINGFLGQFTLPLLSWGQDIKRCCAVLVSVDLIRNIGVGPDDADTLDRAEKTQIDWLKMVSSGLAIPQVVDSTPGATPGQSIRPSRVVSSRSRGFSVRGTGRHRGQFQSD